MDLGMGALGHFLRFYTSTSWAQDLSFLLRIGLISLLSPILLRIRLTPLKIVKWGVKVVFLVC